MVAVFCVVKRKPPPVICLGMELIILRIIESAIRADNLWTASTGADCQFILCGGCSVPDGFFQPFYI